MPLFVYCCVWLSHLNACLWTERRYFVQKKMVEKGKKSNWTKTLCLSGCRVSAVDIGNHNKKIVFLSAAYRYFVTESKKWTTAGETHIKKLHLKYATEYTPDMQTLSCRNVRCSWMSKFTRDTPTPNTCSEHRHSYILTSTMFVHMN